MTETVEHKYVASTLRRVLAVLIDFALSIAILIPFPHSTVHLLPSILKGQFLIPWLAIVIQSLIIIGIFGFLLKSKGITPGKYFLGLRVVSTSDKSSLTWGQSFGRVLVPYLNLLLGTIPVAIIFFDKKRRQLADWICGTRVIQNSPRKPVKIRWFIGGILVLNGLWYIYQLPEKAKLFSISPKGIEVFSPVLVTANKSRNLEVIKSKDSPLSCFQLQLAAGAYQSDDEKRKIIEKTIKVMETRLGDLGATNVSVTWPETQQDILLVKVTSSAMNIKSLISSRGMLAARAIDQSLPTAKIEEIVRNFNSEHSAELKPSENYKTYFEAINRFAEGKIPKDRLIMFAPNGSGPNVEYQPYLVYSDVVFDSSAVDRVELKVSSLEESQVIIHLDAEGSSELERFTSENIGNITVIEIDNEVNKVPYITDKVSSGSFNLWAGTGRVEEIHEQARYLKAFLIAGPLPLGVVRTSEVECKKE